MGVTTKMGDAIKDIQDINNKILNEVDRICRKHNIKYFMDGGTLIGAVRHKGSIPWDDDVDISMPRKEFERFMKVVGDELTEDFAIIEPSDYGENSFFDFITHVAYKKSTVKPIEGEMEFYNNKLNCIVLDIFVLDDISENKLAQKLKLFYLHLIYGLSWGHRYELDYAEYTAGQSVGVWIMSHIGRLFKQSTLEKLFMKAATSGNDKGYKTCFAANYPFEEMRYIYQKEWFNDVTEMEFDNYKFWAPSGYDDVLKEAFGDYMKLPPKEKQVPEHYNINSKFLKIE